MDWKIFKGAQYAIGQESSGINWNDARKKCQSAGADLASLHTNEIITFIYTDFSSQYGDTWVGGTDVEEEGVWKWANGIPFEFVFPSSSRCDMSQYSSNTKNCLFMTYGRWARVEHKTCTNNLNKYLCQKGVSESKFWNDIEGKEYGYVEFESYQCDVTWDYALGKCEEVGGTLASIPSQEVYQEIVNLFLDSVTTVYGFWIGLKRKGNSFEWIDGESSTYSYWASGEPVSYSSWDCTRVSKYDARWRAKDCSDDQNYRGGLCIKGSTASWARSGRKKRSTEVSNGATDSATVREITCEPLWDNTAGYWNFPYKVPEYCHSKK